MRGALLHVLADLWGSVGVIVAGLVILTTGWELADPLVALLIGVLILASAWRLLGESVSILLEATPRGMAAEDVGRAILGRAAASSRCTTSTSGRSRPASRRSRRTCSSSPGADCHAIRRQIEAALRERFDLEHTTLQVDHAGLATTASVELRRL